MALSNILFFQNCGKFETLSPPIDGFASRTSSDIPANADAIAANGKVLYTKNCAVCHGPIENSAKANRSAALINSALGVIPQMTAVRAILTAADVEAIAVALSSSSTGMTGGGLPPGPGTGPSPGPVLFSCVAGQLAKTPMLKLTNREFKNSLFQLLDGFSTSLKSDTQLTATISNLPLDTVTMDRNTKKEQSLFISQPIVLGFFEAVFRAGALVATSTTGLQNYPNTNQCLVAGTISQVCHQSFVREFGSRAFRRSLSAADAKTLAANTWDQTLSKTDLIQTTVATITSMPDFLYKTYDTGSSSNLGPNVLNLTASELAVKLSFFLTGTPPDDTLRGLAASGQIKDAVVLTQQIDRLLALPASQDTIKRFFRESFGYDTFDNFIYSANFLNGQNITGLQDAMAQELDDYFVNVVLQQKGNFNQLLTSTATKMSNANLASLYGVSLNATTLPPERAGFINRAAMLSKKSGNYSSPIKRGLNMIEHLLCQEIGPPPPSAPTDLPSIAGQVLSTRDRTARTTEVANTSCIVCHSRMNSLGYPFEKFDSLGRTRSMESIFDSNGNMITSVAINTGSTSTEVTGTAVNFRDSVDLASQLGTSNKAMMCFSQHLKRFESRTLVTAADGCLMNSSLTALLGSGGNQGTIIQAIKNYILSDEFSRWSF